MIWKSQRSIIETFDLEPLPGKGGKCTLHPTSKESLLKLGILSYTDNDDNLVNEDNQHSKCPLKDNKLYEIEGVIGKQLSKDAVCCEYKVYFEGYGSEENMWLSAFLF